ncbi:MAG TPA: type II toxin-antitoxin system VapC family toxin [Azospirillum sp.]|nr:type II toxin-antitoxin system VapC family toxin [Azospirillum sp.]
MWVVDASVALKWFVEESGSDRARRLKASPEEIAAPDLVIAEVCNAAWRLVTAGSLPVGQYELIAEGIGNLFDGLWPLGVLAPRAAAMARELRHPIYDCFYVALADMLGTARVVTADSRFLTRVAASPWRDRVVHLDALPA